MTTLFQKLAKALYVILLKRRTSYKGPDTKQENKPRKKGQMIKTKTSLEEEN